MKDRTDAGASELWAADFLLSSVTRKDAARNSDSFPDAVGVSVGKRYWKGQVRE